MVAGHSLGEFSALVAAGALNFEDGLRLVSARAQAMQKACEINPSTMAAIIALPDEKVEEVCAGIEGVVVCANYNCPGQLVISGEEAAIDKACEVLIGRRRKARDEAACWRWLPTLLYGTGPHRAGRGNRAHQLHNPSCPVYQNVDALPHTDPAEIKGLLISQPTAPVRWTQTVKNMVADGRLNLWNSARARRPGSRPKISRDVTVAGYQSLD